MRRAVVLLTLVGCSATSEDDAPAMSGTLTAQYRMRDGEADTEDHDLFGVASVRAGDVEDNGWEASLLARVNRDLDANDASIFGGLSDAEGGSTDFDIYHLWVDLPVGEKLEPLRLGRQIEPGTPESAWFDGARLATRARGERRWEYGVYAGQPVRLYESSSGDLTGGAWVAAQPWEGARARLDVMRLEDEVNLGTRRDDLVGLDLRQRAGEALFLDADMTWLEGDAREARAGVSWLPEKWTLRLRHTELFETQRARALEADPFFDALRSLFPYRQSQLVVGHDLDEVYVEVGADVRRVDDDGDVGEFNRDFERGWASLTVPELVQDLALTLSGDRWESDTNEVEGLGFDLVKDLGQSEASLGTARALYKIGLFFDEERVDVRTWYLRWRRRPVEGLGLDVRYEYDRVSGEDVHGLRLVVTWRF